MGSRGVALTCIALKAHGRTPPPWLKKVGVVGHGQLTTTIKEPPFENSGFTPEISSVLRKGPPQETSDISWGGPLDTIIVMLFNIFHETQFMGTMADVSWEICGEKSSTNIWWIDKQNP